MSEELKPCPFCGETPDLPSGDGTQYEIECGSCAMAMASVQICDLMTGEERSAEKFTDYRYSEQYVERAKAEAIKQWNTRATPPAAQVQGEQPEVAALQAEVANLKDLLRYFDEHGATQAWVMRYKQALDVGARPQTCNGKRCGWCKEGAEPCHYAPPAAGVPDRQMLEQILASAEERAAEFEDDPNGPGGYSCPACWESAAVRWKHGKIVEHGIIKHQPSCWMVKLREFLAAPTPPASEQQQAVVMPELTNVRCMCGDEYPHDSYAAGFIAGSGMCENCDAAIPPKDPSIVLGLPEMLLPIFEVLGRTIDRLEHGHEHDKAIRELRALARLNPNLQPAAPSQGESE